MLDQDPTSCLTHVAGFWVLVHRANCLTVKTCGAANYLHRLSLHSSAVTKMISESVVYLPISDSLPHSLVRSFTRRITHSLASCIGGRMYQRKYLFVLHDLCLTLADDLLCVTRSGRIVRFTDMGLIDNQWHL